MKTKDIYDKSYFMPLEAADQGELPRNLRILQKIEKYIQQGELLDVGVGSGLFLRLAKLHGFSVRGLDVSKYAIGRVKNNFKIPGKVGDLETSKFDKDFFSVINLRQTIEHISSPQKAMKNAYKILKPGGIVCVSTPNSYGFHARIYGVNWPHWCLKYHKQFYSKKSLKQLLKDSGFEILELKTEELSINNIFSALLHRLKIGKGLTAANKYSLRFDRILARVGLGEGLVIVGRKPR